MFSIKKNWVIKHIFLLVLLFLWNNAYLYVLGRVFEEVSFHSFLFLGYIISYVFLIVIILMFYKKDKNILVVLRQTKNKYLHVLLLFGIVYLSASIPTFKYFSSFPDDYILKINVGVFIIFFSHIILGPVLEELFFRGILLEDYIKNNRTIMGIFITSLLFSLAHFQLLVDFSFSISKFVDLFFFGVGLALLRIFFGIKYAIAGHIFRNLLYFLYKYNVVNLFFIDYIHNPYLFYFVYVISLLLMMAGIVYFMNLILKNSKVYD